MPESWEAGRSRCCRSRWGLMDRKEAGDHREAVIPAAQESEALLDHIARPHLKNTKDETGST